MFNEYPSVDDLSRGGGLACLEFDFDADVNLKMRIFINSVVFFVFSAPQTSRALNQFDPGEGFELT